MAGWSRQQVQGLAEAVNESVLGCFGDVTQKNPAAEHHQLLFWYFSKKDLEVLKSEVSFGYQDRMHLAFASLISCQ